MEYDVAIIGGGPGGISAACWAAELGMSAIIIEASPELGGQLLWTFNPIRNYLGIETENGIEMRDIFLRQMKNWKFDISAGKEVTGFDAKEKKLKLAGGDEISAKAIIIAAGISRRKLGIKGEEEFQGKGILISGKKEAAALRGKKACVIGGGDAALENALILAEFAEKVYLVHRRAEFRGREEFLREIVKNPVIEIFRETFPLEIIGNERLKGIRLKNLREFTLDIDALLIRAGVMPNTSLFADQITLDENGYIKIDSKCKTSAEGVYAIGDIANPLAPTISSAAGMGATAAKVIRSGLKK